MGLNWIFFVLLGMLLALAIWFLIEYFFWRDRRVCTEEENRLRGVAADLEKSQKSLKIEADGLRTRVALIPGLQSDIKSREVAYGDLQLKYDGHGQTITTLQSDLDARHAAIETHKNDFNLKLAEIDARDGQIGGLNTELADMKAALAAKDGEISLVKQEAGDATLKLGEFSAELKTRTSLLDRLKSKIQGRETELAGLAAALGVAKATMGSHKSDLEAQRELNVSLQTNLDAKNAEWSTLNARVGDYDAQLGSLRADLDAKSGEYNVMAANFDTAGGRSAELEAKIASLSAELDTKAGEYNIVAANFDTANSRIADLEAQLAACSQERLTLSGNLSSMEEKLTAAAFMRRGNPGYRDDLTKIWGIGPKINEILNTDGIYTFRQLSVATEDELGEIMTAAGKRYTLANYPSWPAQAGLAADELWEQLEELQKKLNWKSNAGHVD